MGSRRYFACRFKGNIAGILYVCLGLIFLRYAYIHFKFVGADILKNRPTRGGRVLPVDADDFKSKSAIFLPEKARYDFLVNLPNDADVGQAINYTMELIEERAIQLKGILPKNYTVLKNDLLRELLHIFNNSAFNEMKDDIIGHIYEYFLNKFAPAVSSDDGVFFTYKSLVSMIVNIIEPSRGTVLDKAVTRLIQGIPQNGSISVIFANGRPMRSYFYALLPVC